MYGSSIGTTATSSRDPSLSSFGEANTATVGIKFFDISFVHEREFVVLGSESFTARRFD